MPLAHLQSFSHVHIEAVAPSPLVTCILAVRAVIPQHLSYHLLPVLQRSIFGGFRVTIVTSIGMCLFLTMYMHACVCLCVCFLNFFIMFFTPTFW